jgi:hypothetical protein
MHTVIDVNSLSDPEDRWTNIRGILHPAGIDLAGLESLSKAFSETITRSCGCPLSDRAVSVQRQTSRTRHVLRYILFHSSQLRVSHRILYL